jgi:predicted metal-dependent HD superfamily phosphohydrolase
VDFLRFGSALRRADSPVIATPGFRWFKARDYGDSVADVGKTGRSRLRLVSTAPSLPWPLPNRPELRDRLVAAYSTGRGYHDLRHLAEVLQRLDELGFGADVEVVLAAWFHDAVYDGDAGDEERSAQLAETELPGSVVDGRGVDVAEVARLVRLTAAHDPAPGDRRGEALSDADLAILAAPPERYREYAADVRRDFAHVSDADFRAGRRAVLDDLLSRAALFRTPYARAHWDQAARANLAAEIEALRH